MIPKALEGKDIIYQAKSGFGKTTIFVLAILQNIDSINPEIGSALVIASKKESILEIHSEFKRLGKYLENVKSETFFEGDVDKDKEKLNKKPAIIIGTPKKILELCKNELVDLGKLRFFVVEECDKILTQDDFNKQMVEINKKTPIQKQVMLILTNFSEEIRKLASIFAQGVRIQIISSAFQ